MASLPTFDVNTLDKGSRPELAALADYLILLNKTLKDQFSNIDEDNFSDNVQQKINISGDTLEEISTISQRCDAIELSVSSTNTAVDNVETDVASLTLTSDAINLKLNNTKVVVTETDGITVYNGGFRIRKGTSTQYSTVFSIDTSGNVTYSGALNGATGTYSGELFNASGVRVSSYLAFITYPENENARMFCQEWLGAQSFGITASANFTLAAVQRLAMYGGSWWYNDKEIYLGYGGYVLWQ